MTNIKRLQRALPTDTEAAIITSKHNRFWLTGLKTSAGMLIITREKACFVTDFRYIEVARAKAKDFDCVLLDGKRADILKKIIRDFDIHKLSIEAQDLSVWKTNLLGKDLEDTHLDLSGELDSIIEDIRMIKTQSEIESITAAGQLTDSAFSHILDYVQIGRTEQEIALEIEIFMRKHGAMATAFDVIAVSGENTSMPHGEPSNRKIKAGDLVTMDFGAVVDGYLSDMTRTIAVHHISDEQRMVYDIVLKAQLAALAQIKAGEYCNKIDAVARDIIKDAGFDGCFGHGLGHSVGVQIHEEPRFSPTCDIRLKSGMIMTVEPGIYIAGKFGVRTEDLILVTENGYENLTKSPKDIIIV
jgi:Xaa-Pro aminopeptidase